MYDRWASRMHRLAVPSLIGTAAENGDVRARTYARMYVCVRARAHVSACVRVCVSRILKLISLRTRDVRTHTHMCVRVYARISYAPRAYARAHIRVYT